MEELINNEEWTGLLKIPDHILLKESRLEVGKLKSYIEELEEELKNRIKPTNNLKIYEGDIKQIQEKLYYKMLHNKNLKQGKKIKQLTKDRDSLIYQMYQLTELNK